MSARVAGVEVPSQLTRYVHESSKFFKETRKPRPAAFFPERHPTDGRLETSVCGRDGVPADRIWLLGRRARPDKKLYGRFDFEAAVATAVGLQCEPAPMPDFDEHAVLLGWPDVVDAKEAWKLIAVQLCNRCGEMIEPPIGEAGQVMPA